MPPRRGIVKSGNAGNSSKASKNQGSTETKADTEKPLFPPGSKYPLNLLHERCQKEGWEKPIVDTINRGQMGYSFLVTLARVNKKTSERETVRLSPQQPYLRPSALEARHWGATYALYRFCNGIQLNRVLPAGPREYWNELVTEHKAAADHLAWMYAADPFAAQKERQTKISQQREATAHLPQDKPNTSSGPFNDSPEVRMATFLRDEVEEAIKEGFALYGGNAIPLPEEDAIAQVSNQLAKIGFKESQIKKASSFLAQPSPLLGKLLESSSPLETATEYLVLSVPESDLPPRFLPSVNSSNPFISSVHAGTSDVKKRWVEEKAVKEAGFPILVVQDFTTDPCIVNDWPLLLTKLGRRLTGVPDPTGDHSTQPFIIDEEELQSLGGELQNNGHYALPSFTAPITLHIFFDAAERYPRPDHCPMFITSDNTIPPYMRLHILSRILLVLYRSSNPEELEHGFGMTLMRLLDEEWALLEDGGPPEISDVMIHMMPKRKKEANTLLPIPLELNKESKPTTKSHTTQRQKSSSRPLAKNVPETITEARKRLPAFKSKADFLGVLSKNRVVIVVGETGSGKTTQLPQYILESFEASTEQRQDPYIVITQPRRISAISVSNRVSEERGHDETVGYAVRGKSKQGNFTQLLFCTTGVILRRLSNGDNLQDVSHVIVDEVHERSLDGDFLLLALKQLLRIHLQLKVILMSATINHEAFSRYFEGAPVLSIPGFTHPVTDRYLEDIIPAIGYTPTSVQSLNEKQIKQLDSLRRHYDALDDQALATIYSLTSSKSIDYKLIGSLVAHIVEKHDKAGILIFLPGVSEIRQCIEAVNTRLRPGQADVFPLHANLPIEEQDRVFKQTSKWKVIAATNVAETSVTIEDIVYVIDAGKVKETRYSPESDLTRLEETLITRAAARQRRGRAGRVQPGICFKLYTRHLQEVVMEEFSKPEILRVPLEQVSLSAKLMNEEADVRDVLGQIIDPPDSTTIGRAWSNLQELGAIDSVGKLTPLGRHIAMLPLDVRLAKMLVLGTIFHCLDPILSITALLSSKPLFISPEDMRDEANRVRGTFATENSDLLTGLEVLNQCQKLVGQPKALRSFCSKNYLSLTTLQEIFVLRREFCAALEERGFVPAQCDPLDASMNANGQNMNLLKAIILGGLWPRVARVHLPRSAIKFDKIQAGTIQRDNSAKEFKMFDLKEGRVFIHPASVLFQNANWKSPFLVYFHKYQSSKVFLRDATEVPMYALLLFGGPVSVNHIKGGVTIGNKDAFIKLKAWPRIGVLVNQLRQLLDLILASCIEEGTSISSSQGRSVIQAILSLLTGDGMTE